MTQSHEQRTCKTCGFTGPVEEFAKAARRKKDGTQWYRHVCQECRRKYLDACSSRRAERRSASVADGPSEMSCYQCQETRPAADFILVDKGAKRGTWCSSCRSAYHKRYREKNPTKSRENHLARLEVDPTYVRRQNLKSYFKLTLTEWEAMFDAQGRVCAVCGADEPGSKNWHTDHDHACCPGRRSCGDCVRGIICRDCNLTLGQVNDDPAILQSMIDYLAASKRPKLRAI